MDVNQDRAYVLNELNQLDDQVGWAPDLDGLKPIYYRLEELSNRFPVDADVQAQVAVVKQHLMTRGRWLKQQQPNATGSNPTFAAPVPPAMGGSPAGPPMPPPPPGPSMPPPAPPAPPLMASQQMPTAPYRPPDAMPGAGQMPFEASRQVFIPPSSTPPPAPIYEEPPSGTNWKKPVMIGGIIGLLLVGGTIGTLLYLKNNKKNDKNPPSGPGVVAGAVKVDVDTVPTGADIQVNNQSKCKAKCSIQLAPGSYSLLAVLPGYDNAIQDVKVEAGHPLSLSLTLNPQAASVKILTDLANNGKVTLDGTAAGALQEGQIALDKVAPGPHDVTISGSAGSEVKFSMQVAPGAAPTINGPINAKNLVAVLYTSIGNQGHITTSVTPMKVSLDGNPIGDTGPNGLDLPNVTPGDHEITLNDGKEDRKLTITATPAPTLTAWVNANTSGGTLVINAVEDNATVAIDGKPYPRKTRHGQIWIPNMPPKDYKVKVSKEGFQDVAEQTASVKKGAETRLTFKLQPIPQIAVLHISGGTPGAQVLIDGRNVGQVDPSGSLSYANVTPGDHTVDIKRDTYTAKSHHQTFRPGETVEMTGDSVILERATGTLRITVNPAAAQITMRHENERAGPIFAGPHTLPAGSYTLIAKAPGYTDFTQTYQLHSGEVITADIKMNKEGGNPPPPKLPTVKGDWERPGDWKSDSGWLVHTGGNFVPFNAQPSTGTFTFSVLLRKGGVFNKNIKWRVDFMDERNYVQYQLDKKSLESRIVINGKSSNRPKADVDAQEPYTLQIDISADAITTRMRKGNQWVTLDTLAKAGAGNGKFGFFIPGSDEIAIAGFTFAPR